MPKPTLLESLESRQLFAAGLTVGPNNLYFNAVKGQSQTYTLRIVNSGDKRVTISRLQIAGDNKSQFKVLDFPAGGRSLGVGVQVNYTVQFTAPSTNTIQSAVLRVYTASIPTKKGFSNVVPMRGLPTNGTSGANEPSLQKIFDLYALPIDSGETDANNYHFPSTPSSTSDEINAQTFVKAGDGPVTVTPIGIFTNKTNPAVRMGYYTPGDQNSEKYLWYAAGDTNQSVNPFYYGTTKFDPGSTEFGLVTQYPAFQDRTTGLAQKVYSEKGLNAVWSDSSTYNHFRVYPFINQAGKVVPNSYVVAEEEYYQTGVADNNDNIFIVTNVKPANATPTISVQNVSAAPDNNTLVFNKVQTPNADVGNLTRTSNTLRVRNTGQAPLIVSLSLSGSDYSLASGGGSNITIAPGGVRDVKVNFNATSGTAIHYGVLTIASNDAAHPTTTVNLVGNWQQYSEQAGPSQPSVEPSASTIVNRLFGYTTDVPTPTELRSLGSKVQTIGDQISAEYFVAADGGTDARVTVTELATFHNQTYTDTNTNQVFATNSYMGWYRQGSPGTNSNFLFDKTGTGQMVLPTPLNGTTTGTTFSSFKPGTSTFGFTVERKNDGSTGEYSDHTLNVVKDTNGTVVGNGQFLRFFIARDKNGVVIPNTYIMLHDYNRPGITNFDFNDNVYLISNIVPVGQLKTAPTATAYRSSGVVLNWTSPADGPKITGFNVYRSTSPGGTYALLTGTPLNARPSMSLHDDAATATSPYYYAIESVGPGGKSDRVIVTV